LVQYQIIPLTTKTAGGIRSIIVLASITRKPLTAHGNAALVRHDVVSWRGGVTGDICMEGVMAAIDRWVVTA
jgi:hypothetical protein